MSKSQIEADTGHGARGVPENGKVPEAENSKRSRRRGNGNTMITSSDVPELLQSVLAYWQQNGGAFRVLNSREHPNTLILVLPGLQWCATCNAPRLFEQMVGDKCQKCAKGESK